MKLGLNGLYHVCGFLVHLSRRLKCTIVITRCPSSVVNFSHFRLLLWNQWTEFNETWQEARSQRPLPIFFSGRSEKQDGRRGLWLAETFFSSETAERNATKLDRKQDLNVLYQFFFRTDRKNKMGRRGLWLAEKFSTSPLKPLNGIQRNLTESKISTFFTKFVFFGPIGKKTRWPPWPLIGWDIFDFSSETAERNSTKLDRK